MTCLGRLLLVLAPAVSLASAGPETRTFVANPENQTRQQVRYSGAPWPIVSAGYLEGTGAGQRLFGDPAVVPGDFHMRLEIALPQAGCASTVLLGEESFIRLRSDSFELQVCGALFGSDASGAAVRGPRLRPDRAFRLELKRKDEELMLSLDGEVVRRWTGSRRGLGAIGLDPDEGVVRLYHFAVDGRFAEPTKRAFSNSFGLQLRRPPARSADVWAPAIVHEAPTNECAILTRSDGAVELYHITKPESDSISLLRSKDGGLTWSEPQRAFMLPGRAYYALQALEAADGAVHVIFHVFGQGEGGYRGRLYEVYHARRPVAGKAWTQPRRFIPGYVGSIRGFIELPGGRLLVAVGLAVPERERPPEHGPDFGWHDVNVLWSDDRGDTWNRSPDRLKVELKTPNVTRYGAIEPVLLPLRDGRIWMLVRDRQGRLLESFSSTRGERWTELVRSRFVSSDSPAELRRLRDGRIVLLSNPCQNWSDPRSYAMGGREVLVAAISSDEGRTWSGFREILHETMVERAGDRGTAYPSLTETIDGKLVVMSGQGEGKRALVVFDPDWLEESFQRDELGHGPVAWTQYGDEGIRMERAGGEEAVAIPIKSSRLGGGSWNFPMTAEGELTLRLRVPAEASGVQLVLNDHFTRVDDAAAADHAVFTFPLPSATVVGAWQNVRLVWRNATGGGHASMEINGTEVAHLRAKRPAALGLNYLRVEFRGQAERGELLLADVAVKHAGARPPIAAAHQSDLRFWRSTGSAVEGAVLENDAVGEVDERWAAFP
jgi:hypothetical protein